MFQKNNLHDEYCVAFIDILGFKSMTSKDQISETGLLINDAIEKMKTIMTVETHTLQPQNISIKTLQFADSVVLLFEKDPYTCLVATTKLMALQFQLATKGIFLRGAICSGQMYVDLENDIYYGEAWNKAVTQEGNVIYPRIIIENNLASMITEWLSKMNESVLEFYLSDDGYHVLDTYKGYYWFEGKTNSLSLDVGYRLMIYAIRYRAFLEGVSDNILRKYYWLIENLKENVKQYSDLSLELEDLREEILTHLT